MDLCDDRRLPFRRCADLAMASTLPWSALLRASMLGWASSAFSAIMMYPEIPALERLGVRMLINEAMEVRRGRHSAWVIGVDDPHYYGRMTCLPPCEMSSPRRLRSYSSILRR